MTRCSSLSSSSSSSAAAASSWMAQGSSCLKKAGLMPPHGACSHRRQAKSQRRVRIQTEPTRVFLRSVSDASTASTASSESSSSQQQPQQPQQQEAMNLLHSNIHNNNTNHNATFALNTISTTNDNVVITMEEDDEKQHKQRPLWWTRMHLAKMKKIAKKQGPTPFANLLIDVYHKVCQAPSYDDLKATNNNNNNSHHSPPTTPSSTTTEEKDSSAAPCPLLQDAKSLLLDFYYDSSQCCYTVDANQQRHPSSLSIISSQRGLELWSSPLHAFQRSTCVLQTRAAVLAEQARQRKVAAAAAAGMTTTTNTLQQHQPSLPEEQDKLEPAKGMIYSNNNDERLRQVSEMSSQSARIFAQLLGQADATIARTI